MRFLENIKSNVGDKRLSTTFKAQPQAQPALNDLRKNLQERRDLETYVRQLINTSDVLPVMETLSRASEQGPATVTGWYTVTMAKCAGLPDSTIYTALNWVMVPLHVDIFNFRRSGPADNNDRVEFMLDNSLYANRLNRLRENVMVMYTCQPLEVHVKPGLPIIDAAVSTAFEKAVEAALRGRYKAATRTLDLSRFHADPHLSEHFCPLHVVKFLEGTLKVARRELQNEVTGIILSNNYLCSLKAFANISADDFSALERLDISANNINELAELKYLSKLPIKTLLLCGNEVTKLESDDIKAILPQLKDIHGCLQTKPTATLLNNLPKFKQLNGGDSGSTGIKFSQRFVKSYFDIFDDPAQRHQLTKFYDNQATFSLSAPKQLSHVSVYRLYNRNHQSLQSSFARIGKLQVGSLAVTQALGRFSRMVTSIQRASVDVLMFNNRLRILALTGYFKEHTSQGWEQRHFQRTFVLHRPEGCAGWMITNDMLSIISTHIDQHGPIATAPQKIFINPDSINSSSPIGDREVKQSTSANNASPKLVIDAVDQAVQELSLSMPRMALVTQTRDEEMPLMEMPPLVAIPSTVSATPLVIDIDKDLEQEIDTALWIDDSLVIDEEVLFGDV
ncbi:nuclear RNA export factor 1 [Drosophila serrata]|uniref:nuclear RNA export factor 1 n=1 Tax=Drosophila serrata TaxID=7274 RepID=UPI000A1D0834|nr:nuclear RNA export factor 1 [Drosophila serrata]